MEKKFVDFICSLHGYCIRTKEIINGNPSGTAHTIITIASETASTTSFKMVVHPVAKYSVIPPALKIKKSIYKIAITTAPIYPNVEI